MQNALIIFVRAPELGKVKTRLAATLGDAAALAVYRRLLEHTRAVAGASPAHKFVFYAGAIPETDLWTSAGFTRLPQCEADLGGRMQAAFDIVLERGYEKAVIIGSDCPTLTPGHLDEAFAHLDAHDAVLGPSKDGGYYLLGLKKVEPALFQNKEWSTDSVLRDTLHSLRERQLSCHLLEELVDVDEATDLPESWRESFLK